MWLDVREIRYFIVNNTTSSQWRGSRLLINKKLDLPNNGRNIILFDAYFENFLISTYWLCFSTRDRNIKKIVEIRQVQL